MTSSAPCSNPFECFGSFLKYFFVINWQVFAVFLNNSLRCIVSEELLFHFQNRTKRKLSQKFESCVKGDSRCKLMTGSQIWQQWNSVFLRAQFWVRLFSTSTSPTSRVSYTVTVINMLTIRRFTSTQNHVISILQQIT